MRKYYLPVACYRRRIYCLETSELSLSLSVCTPVSDVGNCFIFLVFYKNRSSYFFIAWVHLKTPTISTTYMSISTGQKRDVFWDFELYSQTANFCRHQKKEEVPTKSGCLLVFIWPPITPSIVDRLKYRLPFFGSIYMKPTIEITVQRNI